MRVRAAVWFGVVVAVMLAVLGWLTFALLELEQNEWDARREAAQQERLRLALWRMDSWLSPQLAREALRPASDYVAFPAASNAWTRGYNRIGKNEVFVQSPLLGAESPLVRLHFQVDVGQKTPLTICSPQVPSGNERDFAEANGITVDVLNRAGEQLRSLESTLPISVLQEKLRKAVAGIDSVGESTSLQHAQQEEVAPDAAPVVSEEQLQQSVQELDVRRINFLSNVATETNTKANPGSWMMSEDEVVGPMMPVWVDGIEPFLVFARRVQLATGGRIQGLVFDWPRLQQEMSALVTDLFDGGSVKLIRCENPGIDEQATMLASVPARLVADDQGVVITAGLPVPLILWTTWGVTLIGLCALGLTMQAAIGFGERRARFASAVTHELRTPLTTFRMYSEMLAEGVITDPADQQHYLRTLQAESDRLARVVENVLAWSRLEEGRFTARRQKVRVSDLVDGFIGALRQRLEEAGMSLELLIDPATSEKFIDTDSEAVGQILFNLVDNAAKYAASAAVRVVRLAVESSDNRVTMTLSDAGPGVARGHRESIFVPFDRGAVPGSSNEVPGVGLGLPLARGLARDLQGDLSLADLSQDGACFVLELPSGSSPE
jgi:signal transduction histidine kinase